MNQPPLSQDDFRTLVALAKRVLWQDSSMRQKLQQQGINITPASFYSPIPMLSELEQGFEYAEDSRGEAPFAIGGLYDDGTIGGFSEAISGFAAEFEPPVEGNSDAPEGFFWANPAFSRLDAVAYYCILRHLRPQRVLEVGSGYSTLIADLALRRNGHGELVIVEPYPKAFLRELGTVSRMIEQPIQSIPLQEVIDLVESCQVWFIDSTHTVKSGSDCLYLYLKVMPSIRTPVVCHSHDIFLPYGMPRRWVRDLHIYWTEQYLLHAYLLDNSKARILFGSNYVHRNHPELSARLMMGRYESGGASLWYSLNCPDGTWIR